MTHRSSDRGGAGRRAEPERGLVSGATGEDTPRAPRNRRHAAMVLLFYGGLIVAATVWTMGGAANVHTAPPWALGHLVLVGILAKGLLGGHRWAWRLTFVLVTIELLSLLPLVIGGLGGPGLARLIAAGDIAFVAAEVATLVVLIGLLRRARPDR